MKKNGEIFPTESTLLYIQYFLWSQFTFSIIQYDRVERTWTLKSSEHGGAGGVGLINIAVREVPLF